MTYQCVGGPMDGAEVEHEFMVKWDITEGRFLQFPVGPVPMTPEEFEAHEKFREKYDTPFRTETFLRARYLVEGEQLVYVETLR